MSITETLFDGPLDIIGDIHGEAEALARLLEALGYGEDGRHPTRRLVFVGDLVDRGPDSPGVVERVQDLMASGRAQCVLGNHELNILMGHPKDGNGWFHKDWDRYGRHPDRGWCYDWARAATGAERERYLAFFRSLPLALERPDLRVVHACWHEASLAALEGAGDPGQACRERSQKLAADMQSLQRRIALAKLQLQQRHLPAQLTGLAQGAPAAQYPADRLVTTSAGWGLSPRGSNSRFQ